MISNLASIHHKAKIGDNVKIDPFAFIDEDVEIGDGTWIGPNASIFNGARIGKNCKIFPGAVISGIPQDLKFDGEKTIAILGDGTTVRESATINRGTKASDRTIVGKNCLIMAYAHIAHDCIVGDNVVLANSVALAGHVEVGNYVVLGGITAVHQFNKIGEHSMVSAHIFIKKDIPPYVTVGEGNTYKGLNSIGLKRRGFGINKIREIQDVYRILFQESRTINNALSVIKKETLDTSEQRKIIDFVEKSEKGIIRGSSE